MIETDKSVLVRCTAEEIWHSEELLDELLNDIEDEAEKLENDNY